MEGRRYIEKQAEGLEGLSKTLSQLEKSGLYVIDFDFNKKDPRSQKAVFIVDTTQTNARVYHFDLMGRPLLATAIKNLITDFLTTKNGLQNVSDNTRLELLKEGFTDVSREKTMSHNSDFLFGYSARMDPDHRNFTREEAVNSIELYRTKPSALTKESNLQVAATRK